MNPTAPPIAAPRIVGFDLARAIAICGMIVVHFAIVLCVDYRLGPRPLRLVMLALDGRAAALFVILAGVGISLRAASPRQTDARNVLIRRGIFLLVIGFLNLIIWKGDILRVYGVSLILAAFLLNVRSAALMTLAAAFVIAFVAVFLFIDYDQNWDWATFTYHRLWTPAGIARNLFYDGFRSVLPWTGMLIFGMWLGRRDASQPAVAGRMLVWGAIVAVIAHGVSFILVYAAGKHGWFDAETSWALFGTESMPPLPLFVLSAGGTATAVIGACLLLAWRFERSWWCGALVSTGRLAFTWYVGHIVISLGGVLLLGYAGTTSLGTAMIVGLAFFVVAVVISALLRRWFKHGPLEWMMRKIAG